MLLQEMQAARRKALLAASALADLATAEARDFTPAEVREAEQLMREADNLKGRIAQKGADDDLRAQVAALGGGDLGDFGGLTAKKGSWAAPFKAALQERYGAGGYKQAVLPGQGGVRLRLPTPMTAPAATGERIETLLQLLPRAGTGDSGLIEYLRETARELNAAPVAPGALKPTSTITLERIEDRARTIAHLAGPMKRQDVRDFDLAASYVDTVLRLGLILALEDEVINGDGTGQHFTGFMNIAGTWGIAFDTDAIVSIRKAITVLEGYPVTPDAVILNPADYEGIELQVTTSGAYLLQKTGGPPLGQSLPLDRSRRVLWGLPVILSIECPECTGIVGAFQESTGLYEYHGPDVSWSEAVVVDGHSAFELNNLHWRAEGEWALQVSRPAGIAIVDLCAGS